MPNITELLVLIAEEIKKSETGQSPDSSSTLGTKIRENFQRAPTQLTHAGAALPRLQHLEAGTPDAYMVDALSAEITASSAIPYYQDVRMIVTAFQECADGAQAGNTVKIFSSIESLITRGTLLAARTVNAVNTGTHLMGTLSVPQVQGAVSAFQTAGTILGPAGAGVGAFTGVLSLIDGIGQLYRQFGRSVASKALFTTVSTFLDAQMPVSPYLREQPTNVDMKYAYLTYLPSELSSIAWVAYKYKPSWFENARSVITKIGLPILVIGASILTLIVVGASIASLGTAAIILAGIAGTISLGLLGYKTIKAFYSARKLKEIQESLELRQDIQRVNIGATQSQMSLYDQVRYCCLPPISIHRFTGVTLGDYLRYFTALNFLRVMEKEAIELTFISFSRFDTDPDYRYSHLLSSIQEIAEDVINSVTISAMEIIRADVPEVRWKDTLKIAQNPQKPTLDRIKAFTSLLRVNR